MSQTIAARYENGVFLPLENIILPNHSVIRLIISDLPTPKARNTLKLKGILSDSGLDITDEDIRELRSEMWKNFPRDIS